jgi:hypothetical protein
MQNSIRKDDLIVEQNKATNLCKVQVAQCLGEGEDRNCGQSRYNIITRCAHPLSGRPHFQPPKTSHLVCALDLDISLEELLKLQEQSNEALRLQRYKRMLRQTICFVHLSTNWRKMDSQGLPYL